MPETPTREKFLRGDADNLQQGRHCWSTFADRGAVEAAEVVVALGPWSDTIASSLGYRKRGYQVHFETETAATLTHPVVDVEGGYVLAPMAKGLRPTTGVEFASRGQRPNPVQLDRTEPMAGQYFPDQPAHRAAAVDGVAPMPA